MVEEARVPPPPLRGALPTCLVTVLLTECDCCHCVSPLQEVLVGQVVEHLHLMRLDGLLQQHRAEQHCMAHNMLQQHSTSRHLVHPMDTHSIILVPASIFICCLL